MPLRHVGRDHLGHSTATAQPRGKSSQQRQAGGSIHELASWLFDAVGFARLAGFGRGAFLERGFAAQFHPALVVDPNTFYPDHLAHLGDVFRAVDPEIRQLRNMDEAIFPRQHFDERAEFLDRNDATVIGLAHFDLARHPADNFLRARHAFGAGRVDVDGAVIFDVNLRAGFGDDALNRLATGPDERADLLRIDLERLNARSVLAQITARLVERLRHDSEDFRARFFRAHGRFGHDFVADARQLEIELESGDAGLSPANLVIHVAEMILGTDDVGEKLVTLHLSVFAVFRDQADADSSNGRLDRNAVIHEREHSSADARHGAGTVRLHNLARDADGITEVFRAGNNWLE